MLIFFRLWPFIIICVLQPLSVLALTCTTDYNFNNDPKTQELKKACREIVANYFATKEPYLRFAYWYVGDRGEGLIFEDNQHLCTTKFIEKHAPSHRTSPSPSTISPDPSTIRSTWLLIQGLVERLVYYCIDNGHPSGFGKVKGMGFGKVKGMGQNREPIDIEIRMTVNSWENVRYVRPPNTVLDGDEVKPLLSAFDTESGLPAKGPVPDQTMSREGARPVPLVNSLQLLPPKPFEKCRECCQFAAIEDPKARKICLACTDEGLATCAGGIGACAYLTGNPGCYAVAGGVLTVSKFLTGIIKCCSAKYEDPLPPKSDVTGRKPYDHIVRGLDAPPDSFFLGFDDTLL